MGVEGVNPTSVPGGPNTGQIALPLTLDPELQVIYKPLIDYMATHGMGDKIPGALSDLEGLTDQLLKQFSGLDINRSDVRRWLSNTINKQLKDPGSHPLKDSDDFSIRSWVMIGRRELYALVNVKRKNLGFFRRMASALPANKVTRAAFLKLFHPEKDESAFHELFHRKTVDIDNFAKTLENEVFPFASAVSSDELGRVLRLFSARKFVIIDKDKMSDCVKTALFNLAKSNIEAAFPSSKDDEIKDNKTNRDALMNEISLYLNGGQDDNGNDLYDVLGLSDKKEAPKNKAQELDFNYFKDDEKNSILFASIKVAYDREKASDEPLDVLNVDVLSSAGLSTLWGEAGGLVSHLEAEGLTEQNFNRKLANRYKNNDDATKNFITAMFIDWGLIKDGPKEWRGFPKVGPANQPTNGTPLNTWVYWMLKHPKEVGSMEKLDKPVVPPEPVKTSIPK
jgi:hypothetical protein